MILNDEKFLELLKEANLIRDNNYYFNGLTMPNVGQYALFGAFASFAKKVSGYLFNYTEDGIGIIPCDNLSGNPMIEHAYFLSRDEIKKVEIVSGGLFFYKKISIIDIRNQAITFKVVKNVIPVKKYRENLDKFISDFQN